MISQSGGRQEEDSVEGKEVPSEISKLIDETISRIQYEISDKRKAEEPAVSAPQYLLRKTYIRAGR